jgi:D-alanyl-D-alanine carboxypeptidase
LKHIARTVLCAGGLFGALALAGGCDTLTAQTKPNVPQVSKPSEPSSPSLEKQEQKKEQPQDQAAQPASKADVAASNAKQEEAVAAFTDPTSLAVLVNKERALPEGFQPKDLVDDPQIPFLSGGGGENRLMRKEVAQALKEMFAAAEKDGIHLVVASAYRSHATQTQLFNYYVKTQGETEARRYSAVPGHSEHETGLAVDLSGRDGTCAVEDCFADTKEAKWIAEHAHEFGFIIRYPKGKEAVTGYAYEPWHLRYLGKELAQEITAKNTTMEEYFNLISR